MIRAGWETFKKRPWFFVFVFLVLDILSGALAYRGDHNDSNLLIGAAIAIMYLPFRALIEMGRINILLKAHEGAERVSWKDVWAPSPFWKFLLTLVAYLLIIIGGFILLIVPGIVWSLKYMFAPYLVMSRKLGVGEALKESARITNGKKWQLLWFVILLCLVNILGALCLLVGLLVTIPLTSLAVVHAYRTLEQQASEPMVA